MRTEGEGTVCLVPPVSGGPPPGGTLGGGRRLALHPPSGAQASPLVAQT